MIDVSFQWLRENDNVIQVYQAELVFIEDSIKFIVHWDVPGAFCNPDDGQISLQCLWCEVKQVLSGALARTFTIQYPLIASTVKNNMA